MANAAFDVQLTCDSEGNLDIIVDGNPVHESIDPDSRLPQHTVVLKVFFEVPDTSEHEVQVSAGGTVEVSTK